jgi:hypothetical protein
MGHLTISKLEEYNSFRRYSLVYTNESIRRTLVMRILRELVRTNSATVENIASFHEALIKLTLKGSKTYLIHFFKTSLNPTWKNS